MFTVFRRLLPAYLGTGYLFIFILVYGATEAFMHFDAAISGPNASGFDDPGFRLFLTGLAAFLLGVFRILRRHPFYDIEYFTWLATSPWKSGRKLPSGPLNLHWHDLLHVTVLVALDARFEPAYAWHAPCLFLLAYIVTATIPFVMIGRMFFYILLFAFSGLLLVPFTPLAICTTLIVLYVLIHFGNNWLMIHFPWHGTEGKPLVAPKKHLSIKFNPTPEDQLAGTKQAAGWPHTLILNVPRDRLISVFDGIMLSLLAGWWICMLWVGTPGFQRGGLSAPGVVGFFLCALAVVRIIIYCKGTLPPINIFGRFFTFRFIIPRHDYVYLPSLLTVLLVVGMFWVIDKLHFSSYLSSLTGGATFCAGLMILLLCPPSLRNWKLTGHYRSEGPSSFDQHPVLGLKRI